MMEATAKSVTLLTPRGGREKNILEVLNMGRPTTFKGAVNGPREQEHGHIKKRLYAAQVLEEITNEENLLHKLKSLIVPAPRLFKWLFNFNHTSAFVHNDNFFEGYSLLEKKEKKKKENHCFHDPQSDESINYPFFFSSRGRKQHIVLSSYQSLPPSQDATVGGARRDTNTESGWVGGRTSWWWWKDQHLFIYLQDDRGGRAPAETGLIFLQFWGTLWFVTSVVSPSAKNLVNG